MKIFGKFFNGDGGVKSVDGDLPVKPFRAGGAATAGGVKPNITFTGNHVLLADVSEFQPNVVDATYLKWSKAVVIRAMYGDAHDDKAWYGGARRADLHKGGAQFVGIYQYLVAGQSGAAQAQAFKKLVGNIQKGEVFIADFEEGSKPTLTSWYNEMVKQYGSGISKYLWTYSGLYFGQTQGVMPVEWLADYTSTEPVGKGYKLWQFSSAYSVPGVGSCDCSVFHGTISQLAALAYQGAAPAPAPAPANSWTYPKPANLKVNPWRHVDLSWSAVSHNGVKAKSYTVQILMNGKERNRKQVVTTSTTLACEPGDYQVNVWGNGAPVGSPHATVTFKV